MSTTAESYFAVFNACPDPMLVCRQSDGACLAANASFTALTGFMAEAVTHPTFTWISVQDWQRMCAETPPAQLDITLPTQSGALRPAQASARPIMFDGMPCRLVILRDATSGQPLADATPEQNLRQRAEARLEAAESPLPARRLPEATQPVLDELRVHQIELEMQNEALRRKQAELDAAQARYFDLYDLAPVGYLSLSEHGLIQEANLTAAGLLGLAKNTLVKQPLTRFIVPEDQDIYYRLQKALLETGASQACELRLACAGSAPFWARLEAQATPGAGGNPGCRVVISNVSARKQAETDLRASEAYVRAIVENTLEGILQSTPDGRLLSVNAAMARMFGYASPEEMLALAGGGRAHPLYARPEDHATFLRHMEADGLVKNFEVLCRRKDGTLFWTNAAALAVRNAAGTLLYYQSFLEDITERKQAEEALRSSEEKYRMVFAAESDALFLVDQTTGALLEVNQAASRLYGYPYEDLLRLKNTDMSAEPEATAQATKTPHTAIPIRYHKKKDGTVFPVEITASGLELQGRPMILAAIRDISERLQLEQALRASEARFHSLFENSPIPLWEEDYSAVKAFIDDRRRQGVTDFDEYFAAHPEAVDECQRRLRVMDVNRAAVKLYGAQTKQELLDNLDRVQGQRTRSTAARELAAMAHGVTEYEDAHVDYTLTGEPLEVILHWLIPAQHEQTLSQVIVSVVDITDRKRAEEEIRRLNADLEQRVAERTAELEAANRALQESEGRFRTVLENSQDAAYQRNLQRGGYDYMSPVIEQITGWTVADMTPTDLTTVLNRIHPDDRAAVQQEIERSLAACRARGRAIGEVEYRLRCKDGQYRWMADRIYVLADAAGQPLYLGGTFRDIVARKQAEAEIRQLYQELEQHVSELKQANAALTQALQVKNEFLAVMSHELRTPLTAVLGLAEALDMDLYGPLTDKQHHSIQSIRSSGRHLLDLITDVLDFVSADAGRLQLSLDPVVLDELCQISLRQIRGMIQRKKLRLTVKQDRSIETMQGDGYRLKQMLVKLLENAAKFTPEGGALGLEISGNAAQHEVEFTVWDTGLGITPADQARLFQPFAQLDTRLARQFEGTGIGLALVRRLAELQGGRVTVESAGVPGQGSRFTFYLPWNKA